MYSLSRAQEAITSPKLLLHELNRLYHTRLRTHSYNNTGIEIFEEDWDNLVVLDVCRQDMYKQIMCSDFDGSLKSVESRGSSTPEWLYGNFHQTNLTDTVYVTSNPNLYRNHEQYETSIHKVINIWSDEDWDDRYETVLPETTTEYGIEASEHYPNKRLVVHFMQPHYPFISEKNDFYDEHQSLVDGTPGLWQELNSGTLNYSTEKIWEAYCDNLRRAIPAVSELVRHLTGKTVITFDHGNMIGESSAPIPVKRWGHPPGIYTEQLVTVPWHELPFDGRKTISAGSVGGTDQIESDVVEDRLSSLGYK